MASCRVIFRSDVTNKAGENPVIIQIIHQRVKKIITLFSVNPKFWDEDRLKVKRSHPKSIELNNYLGKMSRKIDQRIFDLSVSGQTFTMEDILSESNEGLMLSDACDLYVREFLSGRNKSASSSKYVTLKKHIEDYRDIPVRSIDMKYMNGFRDYLRDSETINSEHTVSRYMKAVKSSVRAAWSKGINVDRTVLSFRVGTPRSDKEKLSKEEFREFSNTELTSKTLELYRDACKLCYYLRGIRIGDCLALDLSNFKNGRLEFIEQKTNKTARINPTKEALDIIDKYSGISTYLIPILTMSKKDPREDLEFRKHISSKVAQINKGLKLIAAYAGIKKKVTTHTMRHTFSAHAIKSGISVSQLSDILNHSSIRVTENYIQGIFRDEELDEFAELIYRS